MSLVVEKALNLIDLIAGGTSTLSSLIKESGLSRSTTHRLLTTLVSHGYLSYSQKKYELGFRFLEMGEKKKLTLAFVEQLHPVLQSYAKELGDTLHLAILDGTDIILLDRVSGNRELQIRSHVGQRAPAFRTAVGKALISQKPTNTWSSYLQNIPEGYSKKASELRAELEIARKSKLAMDYNEVSLGTCGIASCFKVSPSLIAAVSINGATVYFSEQRMQQLKSVIKQIANHLTQTIEPLYK